MSKLRCNSLQYGFSLRRHQWQEREGLPQSGENIQYAIEIVCIRCGKARNPQAGLKMFKPVKKKLDKSTSTEVLCAIGEGQ